MVKNEYAGGGPAHTLEPLCPWWLLGCSSVVISLVHRQGPGAVCEPIATTQMEDLRFVENLNWFTPLQGRAGADNPSKAVTGV